MENTDTVNKTDAVDNKPVDLLDNSLAIAEWQAVDPAYLKLLRINLLFQLVIAGGALAVFLWFMPPEIKIFFQIIAAIYGVIFLWLFFRWAPKTVSRLQYWLRDDDIQMQKGYLYWRHLSIASNRIQHLEVTQGPIERYLGLSSLVIYTAGTMGSDMKLPGLRLETAQTIKARLLKKINAEEIDAHEDL